MRSIQQKNNFGCGVACFAFLTKLSYDKALQYFESAQVNIRGYYCRDLVKAFLELDIIYNYRYLTPKLKYKIYRPGTIVFIKRSKKYPAGHYLAKAPKGWMDPWINFDREKNVKKAKSGFIKRLPEKPIYVLFKSAILT